MLYDSELWRDAKVSDRAPLTDPLAPAPLAGVLASALAILAVAVVGAGCGGQADPAAASTSVGATPPALGATAGSPPDRGSALPRLAPTVQAAPPSPEPLIALATADAARLTGTGPGDVRIVRLEAREWPDRSLGCPRPGMGYAQAITPGFLIVADAGGRQLEYHTDHAQVVLCTP